MHKNNVASDRQKCPEHQIILRGYAVQFQMVVNPFEERVRTNGLIGHIPRILRNQLIRMTVRARIIAARPQSCKARQQDNDQQSAENQPVPPIGVHRPKRNMIRTPRQCNRYEHEDD